MTAALDEPLKHHKKMKEQYEYEITYMKKKLDLPQVDLMNFRVEYVRPLGGLTYSTLKDFSESLRKNQCKLFVYKYMYKKQMVC